MKKLFTTLLATSALFVVSACGTVEQNRESADQIFGTAKMGLVVATGVVALYNVLPVCSDKSLPPPACYNEQIADILNLAVAAGADAIESAEKVFADVNTTEETRLRIAKGVLTTIQELTAKLQKYGVTQIRQ